MEFHHPILGLSISYGSPQPTAGIRTSNRLGHGSSHPESVRHKQWYRSITSMTELQELRILQYNVQKFRDVVLASLFQDRWIREYNVLGIQEP